MAKAEEAGACHFSAGPFDHTAGSTRKEVTDGEGTIFVLLFHDCKSKKQILTACQTTREVVAAVVGIVRLNIVRIS